MLCKYVFFVFEIDLAENVLKSVAHDEIWHLELHVVGGNLVEYALCYLHIGAFVFNDYERTAVVVVDDRVATLGESVLGDADFVGYASNGSFESVGYVYNCVLAHPFFRS